MCLFLGICKHQRVCCCLRKCFILKDIPHEYCKSSPLCFLPLNRAILNIYFCIHVVFLLSLCWYCIFLAFREPIFYSVYCWMAKGLKSLLQTVIPSNPLSEDCIAKTKALRGNMKTIHDNARPNRTFMSNFFN